MRLLWPHACAPLLRPSALHQRLHAATPPLLFGKGEDGEVGDPRKCPMIGAQSSLGGDFNVITAGAVVLAIVALRFALRVCLRRASTALPHLAAWLGLRPRGTRALLAALLALPVVALTVLKRPWAEGEAGEFGEVVEAGEVGGGDEGGEADEVVGKVGEAGEEGEAGEVQAEVGRWAPADTERISAAELAKVRANPDDPADPATALLSAGGTVLDQMELACCWLQVRVRVRVRVRVSLRGARAGVRVS